MWKGNTREACDTILLRPDNLQALLMGILETLRTANCLLQTTGFISLFVSVLLYASGTLSFQILASSLDPSWHSKSWINLNIQMKSTMKRKSILSSLSELSGSLCYYLPTFTAAFHSYCGKQSESSTLWHENRHTAPQLLDVIFIFTLISRNVYFFFRPVVAFHHWSSTRFITKWGRRDIWSQPC